MDTNSTEKLASVMHQILYNIQREKEYKAMEWENDTRGTGNIQEIERFSAIRDRELDELKNNLEYTVEQANKDIINPQLKFPDDYAENFIKGLVE
jgi:hypothetical protein